MKSISYIKNQNKRVNITISQAVYSQLSLISQETKIKELDAIREAISEWVKIKSGELMMEGYKARAEKDLAMMEEFKYRDQEVW